MRFPNITKLSSFLKFLAMSSLLATIALSLCNCTAAAPREVAPSPQPAPAPSPDPNQALVPVASPYEGQWGCAAFGLQGANTQYYVHFSGDADSSGDGTFNWYVRDLGSQVEDHAVAQLHLSQYAGVTVNTSAGDDCTASVVDPKTVSVSCGANTITLLCNGGAQ